MHRTPYYFCKAVHVYPWISRALRRALHVLLAWGFRLLHLLNGPRAAISLRWKTVDFVQRKISVKNTFLIFRKCILYLQTNKLTTGILDTKASLINSADHRYLLIYGGLAYCIHFIIQQPIKP